MSNKFLQTIKILFILIIVSMMAVACTGGETELTAEQIALLETAEAAVAETAAAATAEAAAGDDIPIETIVAQTVEAQNAIATKVQQGIDDALAAQGAAPTTEDANAPDVADPNSGVQQIQPATDPDLPADTPQVRVKVNANVRSGPGTNYPVVGVLPKDTVIPVTAKTTSAAGSEWYLINIGGTASNLDRKSDSTFKVRQSTEEKQQNVASFQIPNTAWIAKSVVDPVDAAAMENVPPAKPADIPAPPATATATKTPTSTPTVVTTGTTTGTPTATSASHHTPTPTTTHHTPTPTPSPAVTLISPTAVPSNIAVNNNTGTEICYLLSAPSGENYGPNHLTAPMSNGGGLNITFPNAGPYNLYAQECEGSEDWYWEVENIFNDYTWNLEYEDRN